jgi:hypothetical protein
MGSRRSRLALCAFALLAGAWVLAQLALPVDLGVLYVVPALLLALPLLLGRYVGEAQLAELADRGLPHPSRRPRALRVPRSHVRIMERGGRLVGSALAKRPPPAAALSSTP